jgi:hypothetical protein
MNESDNDEKHERTRARALAFGYFAIGWGLAYWFWPGDLGAPGAVLHVMASSLMGIAGTVLAVLLWK